MITDDVCLDRARRRVQSRTWFTTFFAIFPVAVLIAIGAVLSVAPGAAIMAAMVSAAALLAPWLLYRRQVAAALAEELRARDGLLCSACYYDLADIPGAVCPECGTPRAGRAS